MRLIVSQGLLYLLLAAALASAQRIPPTYGQPQTPRVVAYVQQALQRRDLASAQALAAQFRRLNGDTPEALEALAWVARGELAAGLTERATEDAEDIQRSSKAALATRSLDSEPHLPLALGAAYEVSAEALYLQSRRAEALQLLQSALKTWHGTSLVGRLQKNINLMTLEGYPLPAVRAAEWLGTRPSPQPTWHGKVVLLLFWAHWCSDCKAEAPVVGKLARELGPKGLLLIAPTRRYGYTADDDKASVAKETQFIKEVFAKYYSALPEPAQVPLDESNFDRFGASTTPTLVVADRRGVVRLYHPGVLSEADLRAVIEPLLAAR